MAFTKLAVERIKPPSKGEMQVLSRSKASASKASASSVTGTAAVRKPRTPGAWQASWIERFFAFDHGNAENSILRGVKSFTARGESRSYTV